MWHQHFMYENKQICSNNRTPQDFSHMLKLKWIKTSPVSCQGLQQSIISTRACPISRNSPFKEQLYFFLIVFFWIKNILRSISTENLVVIHYTVFRKTLILKEPLKILCILLCNFLIFFLLFLNFNYVGYSAYSSELVNRMIGDI